MDGPNAQLLRESTGSTTQSKLELLKAAFAKLPKPDATGYVMMDANCDALGMTAKYTIVHDMLEQITKAGTNKVTGPDRLLVFDVLAEVQEVSKAHNNNLNRTADGFLAGNIERTVKALRRLEEALKVCSRNLEYAVPPRARGREQE